MLLLAQKEQQQLRKILWVFNCNVHFRFHNVYFPCWSLLLPSYLTILLLYNFVKTEHNRWWERTIIDTSLLVWKVGSDHLQSKFKFQNNWFSSFMKKVYLGKWIWFEWRFFPSYPKYTNEQNCQTECGSGHFFVQLHN